MQSHVPFPLHKPLPEQTDPENTGHGMVQATPRNCSTQKHTAFCNVVSLGSRHLPVEEVNMHSDVCLFARQCEHLRHLYRCTGSTRAPGIDIGSWAQSSTADTRSRLFHTDLHCILYRSQGHTHHCNQMRKECKPKRVQQSILRCNLPFNALETSTKQSRREFYAIMLL